MIRVAVDAMGSDRGAAAVIEGAHAAASDEIVPVIFGSPDLDTRGLAHVPTTQVVGMDEKPADAFRTKDDSSLVRAVKAVADGEADGLHRLHGCELQGRGAELQPWRRPGGPATRRLHGRGGCRWRSSRCRRSG